MKKDKQLVLIYTGFFIIALIIIGIISRCPKPTGIQIALCNFSSQPPMYVEYLLSAIVYYLSILIFILPGYYIYLGLKNKIKHINNDKNFKKAIISFIIIFIIGVLFGKIRHLIR